MDTLFISVDYKEFKPKTYNGVVLRDSETELARFNTNNFNDDFSSILEWIDENIVTDKVFVARTSSVDHYLMDSGIYNERIEK